MTAAMIAMVAVVGDFRRINETDQAPPAPKQTLREITGTVKKGETLFEIFKEHRLDIRDLYKIREASAGIHGLAKLNTGRPYKFLLDTDWQIDSFLYRVDDDCLLQVSRREDGYCAEKVLIRYEKRALHVGGTIKENLIASMGEGKENLLLALQLSDIFAWDIDFTTDLRENDSFKIVVEGLYREGRFVKYGDILAAEFRNNGNLNLAYAFTENGKIGYYDETGKSLRKSFLKSPLSFRRISSGFSKGRNHPILKIRRPHHGLDYAAATGTPVSAAGDGTIHFAGHQGQYGKLVIVKHRNGYKTYYGHLSRFGKGIKNGVPVDQGRVIGYVGATGLATGPHLHYEMRIDNKPVNPMSQKIPQGSAISKTMVVPFGQFRDHMDTELASVKPSNPVAVGHAKNQNPGTIDLPARPSEKPAAGLSGASIELNLVI